ncbi:hypothetical protein ACTHQF_14680 [Pedobacter sp. SAFR-022]|uniref:hypothetical protein n=1 Tax=Pedobacter sp. SAFR-022 TaxID=3436861 RepID=UPI003F7DF2BE
MKTRFLIACLTIGLLNSTLAQEKDLISDLIKSRKFAFVVTKVENKPGFRGTSAFANSANFELINPSTASIETSKRLTTDAPVSSYFLNQYYRLAFGSGSYFEAYNIRQNEYNPRAKEVKSSIFLVQQPDELLLKGAEDQYNFFNIGSEELHAYTMEDYKLVSTKKKDNRWLLKYKVGKNKEKRIFYLEVAENGNAILQDQPSLDNTSVMYGNILRTSNKESI